MSLLQARYGAVPPGWVRARAQLVRFYLSGGRNAAKVAGVDALLRRYPFGGVAASLRDAYGAVPPGWEAVAAVGAARAAAEAAAERNQQHEAPGGPVSPAGAEELSELFEFGGEVPGDDGSDSSSGSDGDGGGGGATPATPTQSKLARRRTPPGSSARKRLVLRRATTPDCSPQAFAARAAATLQGELEETMEDFFSLPRFGLGGALMPGEAAARGYGEGAYGYSSDDEGSIGAECGYGGGYGGGGVGGSGGGAHHGDGDSGGGRSVGSGFASPSSSGLLARAELEELGRMERELGLGPMSLFLATGTRHGGGSPSPRASPRSAAAGGGGGGEASPSPLLQGGRRRGGGAESTATGELQSLNFGDELGLLIADFDELAADSSSLSLPGGGRGGGGGGDGCPASPPHSAPRILGTPSPVAAASRTVAHGAVGSLDDLF
jgi:hypothetical protein